MELLKSDRESVFFGKKWSEFSRRKYIWKIQSIKKKRLGLIFQLERDPKKHRSIQFTLKYV
jgi:hypothetical protein